MALGDPALLIVSTDWFARELLRTSAGDSDAFGSITAVEDGHAALIEIWQSVIDGRSPASVLIDFHDADPSTLRLLHALRSDPDTRAVYVALLLPPNSRNDTPGMADPAADLITSCAASSSELPSVLSEISRRIQARSADRDLAAAFRSRFRHDV